MLYTPTVSDSKTVLSVPTGKSFDLVMEHLIYSCPDTPPYAYEQTELITLRTAEDKMEKIFHIKKVVRCPPMDVEATYEIPIPIRKRLMGYIPVAQHRGILTNPRQPYRFYILDEDGFTRLPHTPHTATRSKGAVYFTLAELTAGRPIVVPIP
jgi:hypothetical protein